MNAPHWLRRFLVQGVLWRQLLRWGVANVPIWIEPLMIAAWSLFFLLWGPGRRGVMLNLTAIKPGSSTLVNFFRTYRVFWNFAWTMADNARFQEQRTVPDWEFVGGEYFEELKRRDGGSIMLTAHMGSYDLGAHLFAATSNRRIVMVRAPEIDPDTRAYEERFHERVADDGLRIDFSTKAEDLAFELMTSLQEGEIVAIQGDRVAGHVASRTTTLFGKKTRIPAGPFALAMAARVPIFPLFVMRAGRRRYRLVVCKPIEVVRTSRNREEDLGRGVAEWSATLESVIACGWQQWFTFEPFSEELTA